MELRNQAQTLKKACETSLTQADAQHRASELASKQQIDSLEARLVKLQVGSCAVLCLCPLMSLTCTHALSQLDLEGEQKQKASALINIEQLGLQVEKLQKRIDTDAERAQAEANARTNRIATLEQEKVGVLSLVACSFCSLIRLRTCVLHRLKYAQWRGGKSMKQMQSTMPC